MKFKQKKLKKRENLERMGVVQTITGIDHDIRLNPKKKPIHCQFCFNNHQFTNCPRRQGIKTSSEEYLLSTIYPLTTESIKSQIKYSMPYSVKSVSKPVFSNVKVDLLKANFIIHETVQLPGLPWNQVENMNFKVSFLDRGALPMET